MYEAALNLVLMVSAIQVMLIWLITNDNFINKCSSLVTPYSYMLHYQPKSAH